MNKKLFISFAMAAVLLSACNSSEKKVQPAADEAATEVKAEEQKAADVIADFTQPDVDGKEVSAYSVIKANKLTIVDFWASWCPPCVAEIPNIKKIYDEYNGKGLGILGVSLDKEADAWKGAIKKYEMTWNHVSDLKGWENAAAQQFGVQSIPFMMVVDSEGKVVAKDVRGEALKEVIENYFK